MQTARQRSFKKPHSQSASWRALWPPGRWLLSQIGSFTLLHLLNTSVTLQSSVARFILHAVVQVNMVSRSSTQTLGIIRTRSHHKAARVKTRGQLNRRPRFVLAGAPSSPWTAPAVELEASTTSARLSRSILRYSPSHCSLPTGFQSEPPAGLFSEFERPQNQSSS